MWIFEFSIGIFLVSVSLFSHKQNNVSFKISIRHVVLHYSLCENFYFGKYYGMIFFYVDTNMNEKEIQKKETARSRQSRRRRRRSKKQKNRSNIFVLCVKSDKTYFYHDSFLFFILDHNKCARRYHKHKCKEWKKIFIFFSYFFFLYFVRKPIQNETTSCTVERTMNKCVAIHIFFFFSVLFISVFIVWLIHTRLFGWRIEKKHFKNGKIHMNFVWELKFHHIFHKFIEWHAHEIEHDQNTPPNNQTAMP